jgi:HAD superfamily hydrolase (TIGR01509 family)
MKIAGNSKIGFDRGQFFGILLNMSRFSCIIFDLDGTLTRTNELIYATFNHVAEKYCNRVFTPAEITTMFGPPEDVAIGRLVGDERRDEAMADFYSFYEKHHHAMASAYDGVREILDFVKGRGAILALFTGKGKRSALITLKSIGIDAHFDLVVTGHDVKNYKPSSDGIRRVIRHFGLDPSTVLMVGDAVADVKAAREAGVHMAAVVWDSYARDEVLEMGVENTFHRVDVFGAWLKEMLMPAGERSR